MKKNKILAFVLSLCLTVGLVPSISASAKTSTDAGTSASIETTISKERQESINKNLTELAKEYKQQHPQTRGAKSWITKQLLKGVSKALRAGADNVWVKKAIREYFDSATSEVFLDSLGEMAYTLDECVALGEYASDYIASAIYNTAYGICGDYGTAKAIEKGIMGIISTFVF